MDQIRKGSTRTILLALLAEKAMYGYQIGQELIRRTGGRFQIGEGLLYPALHQMEREGLLTSEWRAPSRQQRRRRYYALTPEGRQALSQSAAEWRTFVTLLMRILDRAGEGFDR